MFFKWLKQHLPNKDSINQLPELHKIKNYLSHKNIWYFNLHSVSRGVAIGLFSAFIPLPFQMLTAALLAIFFRANLPVSILMTWVSNPFTFFPLNYFIFKVGDFIVREEIRDKTIPEFSWIMSNFDFSWTSFTSMISQFGEIYFIGLSIVALSSACIGYFVVIFIWYANHYVLSYLKMKNDASSFGDQEPQNFPWHSIEVHDVLNKLKSEPRGITEQEAEKRLKLYGLNLLPRQKKKSIIRIFINQFNYLLIYILLGAAIISALLMHWIDMGVILCVVLINAIIGVIQEGKAEKEIDAISHMLSLQSSVIRDGKRQTVLSENLVPGDIVLLKSGDKVPADLRLLETYSLQIQEASLTGESFAIEKSSLPIARTSALAERKSMAYSSTIVEYGKGIGIVVATGQKTEIGNIGTLLMSIPINSLFLEKINRFSFWLTLTILAVTSITFLFGILFRGYLVKDMFMAAIGIAVAAIPEGLPAIITIALSIGVTRMAKKHAIIRRLPAVETLGKATVICTDKTGTLTLNELTVQDIITAQHHFRVSGVGYGSTGDFSLNKQTIDPKDYTDLSQAIHAAVLCNDAELEKINSTWALHGNSVDGALLSLGIKLELNLKNEKLNYPITDIIPFESEHKFMATLHHDHEGKGYLYAKGAPERILSMCTTQLSGGHHALLDKNYWINHMELLAQSGQRIIAIAARTPSFDHRNLKFSDLDKGLVFLALFGILDPPSEEAIIAIRECKLAGIKVKMMTGDYTSTAKAIAKKLNITNCNDVLTGYDIDALSPEKFEQVVNKIDIFARTSPFHKLKLVEALQRGGNIVAMTGDGVNDAPALKRADVGIAMGKRGTEAAKEVSDIVLTDDNFSSIVSAVREGRTVYNNILKTIIFVLPSDGGEALIIIVAVLVGWTLPITPLQILWINTVTAITLGLALAFEPPELGIMQNPPPKSEKHFFSAMIAWRIIFVSLLFSIGGFGFFWWAEKMKLSLDLARTITANTIVITEIAYLLNCRNIFSSALNFKNFLGNKMVFIAIFFVTIFQLIFCYMPWMQYIFRTEAPTFVQWIHIISFGVAFFLIVELEKLIVRTYFKSILHN